jgi:hypothetical protein
VPVSAAESTLDGETSLARPNLDPPPTPRSRQILLRAGQRAQSRSDPRATPHDILAALLDEPGGLAARLMDNLEVDREVVRASIASP